MKNGFLTVGIHILQNRYQLLFGEKNIVTLSQERF